MYDLNQLCMALDYIEGFDEQVVTVGELGLIYAILPELLLDLMANNSIEIEMR